MNTPEVANQSTKDIIETTRLRTTELLQRNRDLIAPSITAQILNREINDILRKRSNDNSSDQPGLTLYTNSNGKAYILRESSANDYPIEEDQFSRGDGAMWTLRLPEGTFLMGMGGCQFYVESPDFEKTKKGNYPFGMHYEDVIRVEGDSGELWQNNYFNWDGTAKTK